MSDDIPEFEGQRVSKGRFRSDTLSDKKQSTPDKFQVRFSGEFGPDEGLEFVEVENADGESINLGEWERDGDYWLLKVGGE